MMQLLSSRHVSWLVVAVVVVSCLFSVCGASYYPRSYEIDDYCNNNPPKKITVDRSVRIRLYNFFWSVLDDRECTVNFEPKSGDRLVARFTSYKMELTSGGTIFGDDCDDVAFFLSGETKDFFPNGYCKTSRPRDQYDLGSYGSFSYKVMSKFVKDPKIELLVTEVTLKKNKTCPDGFFDCDRRNYCIDDDLTCNSYNDCGNDDDEIEGCGLTTPIIIGIVCGVAALVVIVIIGVVCFLKNR